MHVGGGNALRVLCDPFAFEQAPNSVLQPTQSVESWLVLPLTIAQLTVLACILQVGADIVLRALSYPLRLIASNAGVNGSVVVQKVLENEDVNTGYNAATGAYEDLIKAGIIDPTKVCGSGIHYFVPYMASSNAV